MLSPTATRSVLSCVLLATAGALVGQDIHYANLSAVPMHVNPAYTGLMTERARVGIDYRSQWTNFTNGYRTSSLSADVKAWQNRSDVLGVGLHATSDVAGDLNFTTQQVALNLAYLKGLDGGKTFVSFGFQNLFSGQRVDWAEARGFALEPGASLESGGKSRFWSAGAGVALFVRPNRRQSYFAGVSGAHLNNPTVSFLGDADGSLGDRLYTKWTGHAGAELLFGRFNSLRPSVIYLSQGPHREIKVGTFWRYRSDRGTHTDSEIAVHFGAYLRSYVARQGSGVDAVNLAARCDYDKTSVTLSFDLNVSSLVVASNGYGGPELSLVQEFDWGTSTRKRHKVRCPTFQY